MSQVQHYGVWALTLSPSDFEMKQFLEKFKKLGCHQAQSLTLETKALNLRANQWQS